MHDERLQVGVSFDPTRGYFTTGSELPRSLTALSLGGLRRRIEAALLPDEPVVHLRLDRAARLEPWLIGSAITTPPVVPAQAGITGLRSWVPATGFPRRRRPRMPLAGTTGDRAGVCARPRRITP
jgi:hypothetical protein